MAAQDKVAEARSTLRVALQVAAEAAADGLLSPGELAETVSELRSTYAAQLASLGVDAADVPDPADGSDGGYDDEEEEEEEAEARPGTQPRRGPGSVASRTTIGSGFTAQTGASGLSRLAQRLELARLASPPGVPSRPESRASGVSYASAHPLPDSRAVGLRREGALPPSPSQSRPRPAAPPSDDVAAAALAAAFAPPAPRSVVSDRSARVQVLAPVDEEARRGGGTGRDLSYDTPSQRVLLETAAPPPAQTAAAAGRGAAAAAAAQMRAAHVASMAAAAAALSSGGSLDEVPSARELPRAVQPVVDVPRDASRPPPRPPPPPLALPPSPGGAPAAPSLPMGVPLPLAPITGSVPKPPLRRAAPQSDESDGDAAVEEADIEDGRITPQAAPADVQPPEQRCFGVLLPTGGRIRASPSGRRPGNPPWSAQRSASFTAAFARLNSLALLAIGAAACQAAAAANLPRLLAVLLVSLLSTLGGHAAVHEGARLGLVGILLTGLGVLAFTAAAGLPYAANLADVAGAGRVRATTHVFCWWAVSTAPPLLAAGLLAVLRAEAEEGALRAALALSAGKRGR